MTNLARTPKQIGAVIQRTRKGHGWSQSELAERAGLRQATISDIERGESPAKIDTLLSVLGALDLEFRIGARSKWSQQEVEDLA
ncbi:helix-turn-helix domain-containing protein [Rhodobacter capsulatus]|uniref:helix-turn-helix domain-containing protein n=1 Tax=Rhodobacter capsulatus TaxID=1061 RepID=UPI0003D30A0A|nr:helix-turn-helix transcriptional regulator [Rhodobacter capsulatus]ETD86373.1 XRE family transcriptional regulator [Rhodobacter capsulatus YW1]